MEDIIIDTEIIATNKKKNTTKYICEHSKSKYKCKECSGSSLCKHNKESHTCRECNPKAFCEHNIIKNTCRQCNPTAFCEHNKKINLCKECNGSRICTHGKIKCACIICNPKILCEHSIRKKDCKICNTKALCEHKKFKNECRQCNPKILCEHNILKLSCRQCNPKIVCDHGNLKRLCINCNPTLYCDHLKLKHVCRDCKGSSICKHEKHKSDCKQCGGIRLCKSEWCEKYKSKKYDNYCLFCYVNTYPDSNISRNHKTKEKHITDKIIQEFPHFSWITDKKIIDGCSRRRPDMLLDMGSHIIIIEIDEYQHKGYDCSCENKRLMEISQDLNFRPIVFIRFNPDEYIDNNGDKIKSPWKINKTTGLFNIDPKKYADWDSRINSLIEQIKYWTVYHTDKMIEIVQLYF
jgi:hypothetical protein